MTLSMKLSLELGIRTLVFALAVVLGPAGCGHGSWDMKVLLDNRAVRIVEVNFKVGSKTPRHYHADAFIYTLSDAQVRITGSDGKSVDLDLKANQALWRNAEMRTLENVGGTDLHVLNFDLRKPNREIHAKGEDPLTLSPDLYSLLMDNDRVRVLEVHAKAGAKSPMHAHPDAVLYFLSDARMKFTFPDGKAVKVQQKKGDAMSLPAQSHAVEILGNAAAEFLVVEMKPVP